MVMYTNQMCASVAMLGMALTNVETQVSAIPWWYVSVPLSLTVTGVACGGSFETLDTGLQSLTRCSGQSWSCSTSEMMSAVTQAKQWLSDSKGNSPAVECEPAGVSANARVVGGFTGWGVRA